MTARTFTDEDAREARALFDQGLGCRQIAARLGFSAARISKWAKQEGVSFPRRAQAAAAAAVREFDMAAARLRLARKMTANADRVLDSLDGPYLVYSFGGKDNTYAEHLLPEAPSSARREAQTVAGVAFDKLTKALERDTSQVESAHSLLDTLAAGFTAAAALYEPGSGDESVAEPGAETAD